MVKGLDAPAENFAPEMLPHDRLRVYALKGRQTTLLWCRDSQNTWQSELAEGNAPEWVGGASLKLRDLLPPARATIRFYDPWRNQWSEGQPQADGAVRLPDFRRSFVVRIKRG